MSGTLLSGQTIVYKNSLATLYTGTAYDNAAVNFNGNDAVALYKISTASYADIFGTIGEDPGTAWTNGTYSTLDKTLVRKETITGGVTINPLPGFPTLGTEWDQYPTDDVSHLGSHTFSGGTVTYLLSNHDVGNVTSFDVTGLDPNTLYHYVVRAYYTTINSPNSNVINVTTNPATVLTVTTEAPTAITSTTATGNGTIVALGSSATTARGFYWDLAANADPDINDFKAEETGSFTTGTFTGSIALLNSNTSYKVRAYATDALGTTYGAVQTFTTLKAEPSNDATNFAAGTTTTTTIPLTWTDATGTVLPDAYLIKGSSISFADITDPIDGTPEVNSLLVQNVNQGAGAFTFIGLNPGTPYYFKIYSYSNSGAAIDYKLGTAPTATATTIALPSGALLYEYFNYTVPGNIGGNTAASGTSNNNWTTHSNSQAGTIDVLTGSLSYNGLIASEGNKVLLPGNNTTTTRDVNRAIPSNTNTVMYYSALINVLDNSQLNAAFIDNGYFMHFSTLSGASAGSLFSRIYIRSSNAGYRLGIQNTSQTTPSPTEFGTDLAFGTTYLVVVKYDFNGTSPDIATLWVDPSSLGGTEPAGGVANSTGTTTGISTFGAICLRNASATPRAEIDEIRVGSTWADVTPAGTASKTLSLKLYLEGLYAGGGVMNQALGAGYVPQFGPGIADQVIVELHADGNYANIVYSSGLVNLSTGGIVTVSDIPSGLSSSYYITIRHRNSIQTTSAAAVSFAGAGPFAYDFSTAASQAYMDVLGNWGGLGVYVIYGGDVNQDNIVDTGDMNPVENQSTAVAEGYWPEDVNGDGIVDTGDMNIVENNSTAVIQFFEP